MKKSLAMSVAFAGLLSLFALPSHAGISLNETRVVLAGPKKEASMLVLNDESTPIMIQSWIEPFGTSTDQDVPFALTPPLKRLNGNARQQLRILYQGMGLPADRESVFWLSVQEIPQKSKDENILQIAVRQRIKLFYRPAGLPGDVDQAPSRLQWRMALKEGKPGLEIRNDSAFHISFGAVNIKSGSNSYSVPATMLPPYSSQSFTIEGASSLAPGGATKIEFESINDDGVAVQHSGDLSS
ncbi:molecular chaperone [Pseudomonas chlororaphis]|uniref:fimbrial biogenesis chaperone n=1 Tax=Pseudomonas chlororaphis TaxID=587753 RepID=UPI0006A5E8DA|nr:molecular chaperone [Pseudomonas chlororaphis]AZD02818.1 putative F17-like fimbrial chaperone [Pseudomonas chlororaphis subsp. chlororaphis]MBM0280845.1 molecular chaperone [Pseudomonas chlororaphis]MDO1504514.1 molecular chaperone [Pseudomonas chlororaphis]ORM44807.1 molecular chaperone [Pseudomonas chlororaphis subsp. chlororaphis]TWR95653.1 molecular chaperone [Pseudomonas chlororaphis subsp. chlororaphis]